MRSLVGQCPNIRLFCHNHRLGQAGCISSGFQIAKGQVVVTMDSDLQIYPEDIPLLLKKIDQGYDLVNGYRAMRQDQLFICLGSKIFNRIMRKIFSLSIEDATSNFVAIRKKFLKRLTLFNNDHRYLIAILKSRGLNKMCEILVRHRDRKKGRSKYSFFIKFLTAFPELLRAFIRIKKFSLYA